MKRSQMIQVIKDALYCHLPTYKECPNYIAEAVLMAIEGGNQFQEGMLPPATMRYIESPPGNTLCSEVCEWDEE